MSETKHVISVLVDNQAGVLARIAMLFSARGYNIESLAVAETLDPSISRMTIVVTGDDQVLEQIVNQLNKLVDTIEVQDYQGKDTVQRELVLIKISTDPTTRIEIMQLVTTFRAKIVDVQPDSLIVEVTGTPAKLNAFIRLIAPDNIKEIACSGRIAMERGQ